MEPLLSFSLGGTWGHSAGGAENQNLGKRMFARLKKVISASVVGLLSLAISQISTAQEKLPLDAFASLPAILAVKVSPDGKQLGMIRATGKDGGYILEIFQTKNLKRRPVRIGTDRMEMRNFYWLNDERVLVDFRQLLDDANEREWVGKSAVVNSDAKGKWLELPDRARIMNLWEKNPKEILISYDANDNRVPDVVRFNIRNGRTSMVMRSDERTGNYIADYDGEVRGATRFDSGANSIIQLARVKGDSKWKEIKVINPELRETFELLDFSIEDPNEVYVLSNQGEDKAGVYTLNIETGEYSERLFGLRSVDAGGILQSFKKDSYGELIGFWYNTGDQKRYYLDGQEEALFKAMEGLFPGKRVSYASRSDNDNAIVIRTTGAKDPGSFYLLLDKSKLEFIGARKPQLSEEALVDVEYKSFKARDGLKIPSYITIPKGEAPFPAIVLPHGGPWARDFGGYDEWAQLLAHHGYVVIQPQFRGSEGYGLNHWMAGDEKWGYEMQDDLDDAAMYLVERGLATKDKLAIFGWSYGGYAAFAGSMRDNNVYQCAIAGAGVSDLDSIRGELGANRFLRELQRPTIQGVSPIDQVDKVNIPILVVHGDIDIRVHVSHSRRFVSRLKAEDKFHKYVELKDADHFSNTLSYDHKTEFYTELLGWLETQCFN